MCCFYWLIIKKLLRPVTGQNRARCGKLNWMLGENREGQRDAMLLPKKTDTLETLPVKNKPCGKIQNNRNGKS